MEKISFGILDFGLREGTMNSVKIVHDLVDYVQYADKLGFSRFWLAEHYYQNRRHAWTNPEPLISILATLTQRIRIGSAGILLAIHQPFHIAAQFKLLNNLFSNRIDLGVANGGVSPQVGKYAVNQESFAIIRETFQDKLDEMLYYLREEEAIYNNGEGIVIPPYKGKIPQIWSLSTSNDGLLRSLKNKLNFSRSVFHNGADLSPEKEKLHAFQEEYEKLYGEKPTVNLAISGTCHDNESQSEDFIRSLRIDPKQLVVGSINKFYDLIEWHRENFGINEFIFKDISKNTTDRMKSLELIHDAFKL